MFVMTGDGILCRFHYLKENMREENIVSMIIEIKLLHRQSVKISPERAELASCKNVLKNPEEILNDLVFEFVELSQHD